MGEFFRGWKRKIGCVTLLMALTMLCFWVRSFGYIDRVTVFCGNSLIFFESTRQSFVWWRFHKLDGHWGPSFDLKWYSTTCSPNSPDSVESLMDLPHWHFMGFHVMSGEFIMNSVQSVWVVPYWSIVIPMTLLSAYLLLSKSCKSTSKKITEPIPEKVE